MQHQISLGEANQHLSRYIKTVEQGEELVITRRGKPVARLVPVSPERRLSPEQQAALERTRERMRRGYDWGVVCRRGTSSMSAERGSAAWALVLGRDVVVGDQKRWRHRTLERGSAGRPGAGRGLVPQPVH